MGVLGERMGENMSKQVVSLHLEERRYWTGSGYPSHQFWFIMDFEKKTETNVAHLPDAKVRYKPRSGRMARGGMFERVVEVYLPIGTILKRFIKWKRGVEVDFFVVVEDGITQLDTYVDGRGRTHIVMPDGSELVYSYKEWNRGE